MPNLPALPDMNLSAVTSDFMTTTLPGVSSLAASGQPVEQMFDNILTSMMESDPALEDSTEDLVFAPVDALVAGMMAVPASPPQPVPDIPAETLLSMILPASMSPNAAPAATNEPASAPFAKNDPPAATVPAAMTADDGYYTTASLQTAYPGNAASLPAELTNPDKKTNPLRQPHYTNQPESTDLLNGKVSNMVSVFANGQDQVMDTANFADSGKPLPPSITPVSTIPVTVPTSSVLSANSPDGMVNDAPAVTAAFGHPDWPEEFSQKITWLATQRMQAAELKLHPAHLGPIEISLQLNGDQQLTAQFISHHPAVREAIEANLPRLREIMAESGITLADTSVSADTPQQQAENGQSGSHYRHLATGNHLPYSPADPGVLPLPATRRPGLIDTFA